MRRTIKESCLENKSNVMFHDPAGPSISYGALLSISSQYFAFSKQKRLALCFSENTVPSLVGYISLFLQDHAIVIVDSNQGIEKSMKIMGSYEPSLVWAPVEYGRMFEKASLKYRYGNYGLFKFYAINEPRLHKDLCLLLTTSGSTGGQKFVKLSKKNVESNACAIVNYLSLGGTDRPITTLPWSYSFGLSIIHSHIVAGATIVVTKESIISKQFWRDVKSLGVTSISGVPATFDILQRLNFVKMDLPKLKNLTQAGGKLKEDLVLFFAEYCKLKGGNFFVMYGQTEAAPRISYLEPSELQERPGSIGKVIPDGNLYIIDSVSRRINRPFEVGQLVYEGENVFIGYSTSRDDLALGRKNNSRLETGDLAYFDDQGFFFLSGRLNREIKLDGFRVNLDEVEFEIHKKIVDVACVEKNGKIVVCITNFDDASMVELVLAEATRIKSRNVRIQKVDTIPRTSSGKLDYKRLVELL